MNALRLTAVCPWCLSAVLSLVLLPGCGGAKKDAPQVGAVAGLVTLDGKPLASATVTFVPDHARMSIGRTDAAGRYELIFDDNLKGAALGQHRVRISIRDAAPEKGNMETLPIRYNDMTELTFEVKEGQNTANFDLTSK